MNGNTQLSRNDGTDRSLRIAIIGAGVSGVLTAIELKKLGYDNVTLYEKGERLTTLTSSFTYQGRNFDLSTKVIPAIGFDHSGVYPPLMAYFEQTGITLDEVVEPVFLDLAKNTRMNVPVFMQRFSRLKILKDFVKAFDLLVAIRQADFVDGAYRTDLIRSTETIREWAQRHDIESFGVFTCYLVDLFNQGPSDTLPACVVMMSRMHFAAPFMHSLFTRPGVKQILQLLGARRPEFRAFLNFARKASSYFVVREGYQAFFSRLADQYCLDIRCSSAVSNLRKTENGLTFTVNGDETVVCDRLIFCCPPPAIAQLSCQGPVKTAFERMTVDRKIRTWAFTVEGWEACRFGSRAIIIDGNNALHLATRALRINGELNYVAKEHDDCDLICSAVYMPHDMSETDAEAALAASLRRFGLKLRTVVHHQDFVWPFNFSVEQHADGVVATVQQHQGVDGIYYCGESFFGVGVPTILEYARKFVKDHFE